MAAPQLAVTFRVLLRTHPHYAVERRSTADGAWHECDRGDDAAAMTARAQGYATAFARRHGCPVAVIPAPVPRGRAEALPDHGSAPMGANP